MAWLRRALCFLIGHRDSRDADWRMGARGRWIKVFNCPRCGERVHALPGRRHPR